VGNMLARRAFVKARASILVVIRGKTLVALEVTRLR